MRGVLIDFRGVEQGLRRDAAFVEADAAQLPVFGQQDLEPARRRPFRGHVAARSTADDDEVVHSRFQVSGFGCRDVS
jgi:hypothetical protein